MPNTSTTIRVNVERLRRDIEDVGWQAADIAKNTRLSKPTVSRLYAGTATPRTLKRVVDALIRRGNRDASISRYRKAA